MLRRSLIAVVVGTVLLAGARAAEARPTWQELPPNDVYSLPSFAGGVALVYDAQRDVVWCHFGTTGVPLTTYTIDPTTGVWTKAAWDATAPALGDSNEAAFDEARGRLVVLPAGSTDVYEWDLATASWSRHAPQGTAPAARRRHALAYDPALGQVVLFGGLASPGDVPMGDIWSWDGAAWTELTPATGPGPRCGMSLVGCPARKVVTMIGGYGDTLRSDNVFEGDVWQWDGANRAWHWLAPKGAAPQGCVDAIAAYDPALSRLVYFGRKAGNACELAPDGQWYGSPFPIDGIGNDGVVYPNGGAGAMTFDTRRSRLVLVSWPPQHLAQVWTYGDPAAAAAASSTSAGTGTSTSTGTGATTGDDPFEPNDTLAQAARIGAGQYRNLHCFNDDWFAVSLGAGATLTVTESSNALGLTLSAADGRVVKRSSPVRPSWSSSGSAFGKTLTFTASVAGDYFIRVFIRNASDAYDLDVAMPSANHPPTIAPIADATAYVGQPVAFRVAANDPDGDPVTLGATGLPAGATFDPASGTFQFTPAAGDVGSRTITFTASDASSTTTASFQLTVAPAPAGPGWRSGLPFGALHMTARVTVPVDEGGSPGNTTFSEDVAIDFALDGSNPGALTIGCSGLRGHRATANVADDGTFSLSWELDLDRFGAPAAPGGSAVYSVHTESIRGHLEAGAVLVVDDYGIDRHTNNGSGWEIWTRATATGHETLH